MYKWNRKLTAASLAAITLLAVPTAVFATGITVHVDGEEQQYDVSPYLKNDRTLVPLRGIFESLGATVKWDEAAQTVTAVKGDRSVVLKLGSRTASVNGKQVQLEVAPEQHNDRTMVSVRLISEALGASVTWDSVYSAVRILSPEWQDKTLNLMLPDEVATMDPSIAADNYTFTLLQQTGEGLIRLDQDGNLVPGVAKAWDVSTDGLTYTFHLRDNAKWSDGSAVTAADFEYAWKRTIDPQTQAQWAFQFMAIENAEKANGGMELVANVGVRAIDDRTLQVKLATPQPYFPQLLTSPTFYPLKQSFVEAKGERFGTDADATLSNGPFQLAAWTHESSMRLEKNEHYWDRDHVALEQVNYLVSRNPDQWETLYMDGTIDRMPLNSATFDKWNGADEFSLAQRDIVYFLKFNTAGPKVLQNAKIRRALAYAVDGQALADNVYHDGRFGAYAMVPFGLNDGQGRDFREAGGDLMRRDLNVPKAKQLLAEGLQELGLTEFPHLKLLNTDTQSMLATSKFIQDAWKNSLGIDVELESVPFKLKLQREMSGKQDYDITFSGWAGDYNDPSTFLDLFATGSGVTGNSYSNAQYDKLITAAKTETDNIQRADLLHDAEKLLIDDMPVAPLYWLGDGYLSRPFVRGWSDQAHGAYYDLKHVRIEGRK